MSGTGPDVGVVGFHHVARYHAPPQRAVVDCRFRRRSSLPALAEKETTYKSAAQRQSEASTTRRFSETEDACQTPSADRPVSRSSQGHRSVSFSCITMSIASMLLPPCDAADVVADCEFFAAVCIVAELNYPRNAMPAQHWLWSCHSCVRLSVRQSQAGVVSKRMNGTNWFLAQTYIRCAVRIFTYLPEERYFLWNFVANSGLTKTSPRPVDRYQPSSTVGRHQLHWASASCTRAFRFGQKKFRFDSRYRIDFFDSIRFANLINLPLLNNDVSLFFG